MRTDTLTIRRIYPNDDRVVQKLPRDEAIAEIEYSKMYRPGCSLFIGSQCVQFGYLGEIRCSELSKEIEEIEQMKEVGK